MKRRLISIAMAAVLLAFSVMAQQEEQPQEESAQQTAQGPDTGNARMWLILGGTVIGVAGMWNTLYRRGKK